jgi:hypothetical protein
MSIKFRPIFLSGYDQASPVASYFHANGLLFGHHLLDARLQRAHQLILAGRGRERINIGEIAYRCGFARRATRCDTALRRHNRLPASEPLPLAGGNRGGDRLSVSVPAR